MPAHISLSQLENDNGATTTNDRHTETQRLKELSHTLSTNAEIDHNHTQNTTPPETTETSSDDPLENLDPKIQEAIEAKYAHLIEQALATTDKKINKVVTSQEILAASEAKYGKPETSEDASLRQSIAAARPEPKDFQLSKIMTDAFEMGATDVYIQPETTIRFKIKDVLEPYTKFRIPTRDDLTRLLTAIAPGGDRMVLLDKQELDTSYTVPKGKYQGRRCRLSGTYISPGGRTIQLVFRLLSTELKYPWDYGVPEPFWKAAHQKSGLVIINGVVNSGKSTAIGSVLKYVQEYIPGIVVITIEKPVEYLFNNNNPKSKGSLFIQREVGTDTQSYLNGIYSALRQGPRIIFVGEIRDPQEIQAALLAAETGHLTMTTVHAEDCIGVLQRLASSAETPDNNDTNTPGTTRETTLQKIASLTRVIMTQALVTRIDGGRQPVHELLEIHPSDRDLIHAIEDGNFASIRARLEDDGEDMAAKLVEICRAETGTCYLQDAAQHAPDPTRFWQLVKTEEASGAQFNYHPDALNDI